MNLVFKLCLLAYLLTVKTTLEAEVLLLSNDRETEQLISSALIICKKTAEVSGRAHFYVVSTNSEFPIQKLIRKLHENMIDTVFITHHNLLQKSKVGGLAKNIIVFLNSLEEIMNLILDTASKSASESVSRNATNESPKLNHYCLQDALRHFGMVRGNKTCDFTIQLTRTELDGKAELAGPICELTKSLYANKVWNYNNYITFMLPTPKKGDFASCSDTTELGRQLNFTLRFFWRFFRGDRTFICRGDVCCAYDPHMRILRRIEPTAKNDFNIVSTLQGQSFKVGFVFKKNVLKFGELSSPVAVSIVYKVITDIRIELQCDPIVYTICKDRTEIDYFKEAQQSNFDLLIYDGNLYPNQDFSTFDFSVPVQSCSYCFITSRSEFMPQSLVPFKCFSLQTWAVILTTVASLYGAFYVFQRSQWTLFNRLYSTQMQREFENTSVSFYLYSFLVVGYPSRQLLGRVVTGKILFLIMSFFVLIVGTLFQSKMTTLLSKHARYPDIDTLEDLTNSDLMVQTPDLETTSELLQDYPFYQSLKNKLTEGPFYVENKVYYQVKQDIYTISMNYSLPPEDPSAVLSRLERMKSEITSNLRSLTESDAFEMTISEMRYKYHGNILVPEYLNVYKEFHLVKECMLTFPMIIQVQKRSQFSEYVIKKINAYSENGLLLSALSETSLSDMFLSKRRYVNDDDEDDFSPPEVFTMQHLQPAFVCLILGWILSGIVFALELIIDVSKEHWASRFSRCVEKLIRPSSLWV
ncbi:unnamed protein product [Bemisia tabaci]|uniref:Ionotropic receptor n=1 Tax=Bemisia tabaci TaxID=7038 RepID=A0A9P0AJD6_BEMTA|nr:unnamed protein product [Bemisia tabaci]